MFQLVENTRPAEQARELQQLAQVGEFVGTTDFKLRLCAYLVAEAAAHQTPLLYRDAAAHLLSGGVGRLQVVVGGGGAVE